MSDNNQKKSFSINMSGLAGKTIVVEEEKDKKPNISGIEEKNSDTDSNLPKKEVSFTESGILNLEESAAHPAKEIFFRTTNGEFTLADIPANEFISWTKEVIPLVKHKIPTHKDMESIDNRATVFNQILAYYANLVQITRPRDSELKIQLPH